MRLSVRLLPVAVVIATVLSFLAVPASAAPPPPACGDTITVDTKLKQDLTCPGDGLFLRPGVTLNLGGHTLSGTGTGLTLTYFGVISVVNGTLAGWSTAIETSPVEEDPGDVPEPLTIDRVTFRDNRWGVHTGSDSGPSKDTTITRSTFSHNDVGVVCDWWSGVTIGRSSFVDNRIGLWAAEGGATVDRSTFTRSTEAAIKLYYGTIDVAGTTFVDNLRGVTVTATSSATISGSRFVGGDVGIAAEWEAAIGVTDTVFTGSGTGVLVNGGQGAVERNRFMSNDVGLELVLVEASSTIVVRDNQLRFNGDGILSDGGALLQLGGNAVKRSAGWGINAPGATDLGGNTARNNGNTPQCVGVVCPPIVS